MRVLHTADWHIGQRFSGFDRYEEHSSFLNWLLTTIEEQRVQVLIVAGDIFDTANPTPVSQEIYYSFLGRLSRSQYCKDVIIVGGNHDNPHFLNAPNSILRALNIQVIGAVPEQFEAQCIVLTTDNVPKLVVAAVPFLRERDVRLALTGEGQEEQENRIRNGIAAHYSRAAKLISQYRAENVPVLATGHLFAQGGIASEDSERVIHVGNLGHVSAEAFTDAFDYIALGHLHRHQKVGGHEHIRYSGSPLPLSFSEVHYQHQILILDFVGAQQPAITSIAVPKTRQLIKIRGTLSDVVAELTSFSNNEYTLPAWAEVTIISNESPVLVTDSIDGIKQQITDKVIIVKYQHFREQVENAAVQIDGIEMGDLLSNPELVFAHLLDSHGITGEESNRNQLEMAFRELLSNDENDENQNVES